MNSYTKPGVLSQGEVQKDPKAMGELQDKHPGWKYWQSETENTEKTEKNPENRVETKAEKKDS